MHSASCVLSLLVVCVKGLCWCTVQAAYLSLLVVCVKGLCRCTMQAVYLSLLVVCVKGSPIPDSPYILCGCKATVNCVKGLCQCTVQAVYISLLVVCVKGLCLHSASCVLGSLYERFAQCKLCAWSFL